MYMHAGMMIVEERIYLSVFGVWQVVDLSAIGVTVVS
jgi:hypothetical protein